MAQLLSGGGLAGVQMVAIGACCALVVGGGAVAVPEFAVHASHPQEIASLEPELAIQERPRQRAAKRPRTSPPAAVPVSAPATPPARTTRPSATPRPRAKTKPKRVAVAKVARLSRDEEKRISFAMRMFSRRIPTAGERRLVQGLLRSFSKQPGGSTKRALALNRLQRAAFGGPRPVVTPPAKGLPAATPTPTPPAPTPTAAPVETPTPIATVSPEVTATPTVTPGEW